MEQRTTFPVLRLDLDNFESVEARRNRYVLTSPRSLESCARLGIKPVDLLIKSLNDLAAEQKDAPLEAVQVMHESYERERRKLLQMCRGERERIIQRGAGDRWPGSGGASGRQEGVSGARAKGQASRRPSIQYAELCIRGKPVSRSSCSAPREADRSTVCSFRLGDLRHSPATERKLERLTEDIRREMSVTVSERDRKIAALMLVKHEDEQARLGLRQRGQRERDEALAQTEAQRAQAERTRRRKLRQSVRRWHEELQARLGLRERREGEKVAQLRLEALLQEDRWRRLKEEVEARRRGKTEAARREAEERQSCQRRLLRERQEAERRELEKERRAAEGKSERAERSRERRERRERTRLREENHREQLRHLLLRREVEQRAEEEAARTHIALEERLRLSRERRARAAQARLRELQERAVREDEQAQRARLRSQLQTVQRLTHQQVLVQQSRRRAERAAQHAAAQLRARALHARQHNRHRSASHQRLRERQQREEEAGRRVREGYLLLKEWRRERLRRQREQIQREAQTLARASFHMRERARELTGARTFDQMALQAQLAASLSNMKLQ